MNAGRLDRQVTIRKPLVESRSTDGEANVAWSTVLRNAWANVEPITGREMFLMDQRYSMVTHRVYLRYTTLITPDCIMVYDGNDYDIKAVIDIGERHRELELRTERIW